MRNEDKNIMEKKVWTKQQILELIDKNDTMVMRSLLKLYNMQTEDEQEYKETVDNNGVGFNQYDCEILTNIAKFVIKTRTMTPKQISVVRRKIRKYAGQLVKIANGVYDG